MRCIVNTRCLLSAVVVWYLQVTDISTIHDDTLPIIDARTRFLWLLLVGSHQSVRASALLHLFQRHTIPYDDSRNRGRAAVVSIVPPCLLMADGRYGHDHLNEGDSLAQKQKPEREGRSRRPLWGCLEV